MTKKEWKELKEKQNKLIENYLKKEIDNDKLVDVKVKKSSLGVMALNRSGVRLSDKNTYDQLDWVKDKLYEARKKVSFWRTEPNGEVVFGFRASIPANKKLKWRARLAVVWVRAKDLELSQKKELLNIIQTTG